MPWTPLLDGPLAETAMDAARGIAVAVAATPPPAASSSDRTLFWAYASNAIDEPFARHAYEVALDDLIAELRTGAAHPALYGGLAGLGFPLGHVLDAEASGALSIIDEALVRWLAVEHWPGSHDLVHGLVGLGVYFLERIAQGPAPIACDGLSRVVGHLGRAAIETPDGMTWRTPPATAPPEDPPVWPRGFYDCGVAHGVPGVIALLARASGLADPPPQARALCAGAVRWLAAQRRDPDPHGRFPRHVDGGHRPARTRAAWCYGDPGIAAALWGAAPALALETARDSARREAATCGVRDACLCHGAAGLAHLHNRFFQASGDAAFGEAARTWFARALDLRRPGGVGGFALWTGAGEDSAGGWQPVASLLEGAIGIGLALFAAVTPVEPGWDRLLLCDVPPRQRRE